MAGAAVVIAVVIAAVLVGCTPGTGGQPGSGGNRGGTAVTKAGQSYGYGPVRDESIRYQPDVVFVDGGPDVIRSASSNGLTWTIDASARGASDVTVGKVMYVTSRAVGRVAEVRRAGGDLEVTLAPVTLTEVFRDAHFTFDRTIDDSAMVYQEVPDLPGKLSVPQLPRDRSQPIAYPPAGGAGTDGGHRVTTPAIVPVGSPLRDGQVLPPVREANFTASVGEWEAQPYRTQGKLGLKVAHAPSEHLKVGIDFSMKVDQLRVRSDVSIANGTIGGDSTFALEGIKAIAITIAAGAANGSDDNKKVRVEVPVEINIPIPGEPLVYSNTWKFIVSTALTGKNSTLTAAGEWALDGAIGLIDGSLVAPALGVTHSILDSITGLTLGPSGIAFAVETKVQFGIGIPAAFTGPYAKLVVDLGLTNGSSLGAPLARCVGGVLDARVGGGFGANFASDKLKELTALLPKIVKFEFERETLLPFYHSAGTVPDVPLCTGPS